VRKPNPNTPAINTKLAMQPLLKPRLRNSVIGSGYSDRRSQATKRTRASAPPMSPPRIEAETQPVSLPLMRACAMPNTPRVARGEADEVEVGEDAAASITSRRARTQ
jgi:hypothetical protein